MGQPDMPPSSAPQSSQVEPRKPAPSYRNVQTLPAQLLEHCTVCIEEQLYSQAIALLQSAVTAGNGTVRPANVPPPQHLSLLATLVVHPSMTTRTTSKEKHVAADEALRYLHHLNSLTSADASGLAKALQFRDSGSSRSKRARGRQSDISSDDENDDPGRIRSSYAKKESLFGNAEDIWAAVGWAFNCSVAHKNRWDRWRLWLEFMFDVLEDDLDARHRQAAQESPENKDKIFSKSLLATYLAPFIDQGRNPKRRIMRAILADGTQPSLNQFPSIYINETRPPKSKEDSKIGTKRSLDLDQGEFGDYFDSDSDDYSNDNDSTPGGPGAQQRRTSTRHSSTNASSRRDSPAASSTSASPPQNTTTTPLSTHGGPSSLTLRLRLLSLLTHFSSLAPTLFLDPEDLFDLYTEFLRPLPLPIFSYLLLSHTTASTNHNSVPVVGLDPNSLASLTQMLLRPLLSSQAPISNANSLTPESFATHFAPFAANVSNVNENSRVGVCVEVLLRLLWTEGAFTVVGEEVKGRVREAVLEGIRAREERAGGSAVLGDGRRRSAGGKVEGWEVLRAGGERLRGLLGMVLS